MDTDAYTCGQCKHGSFYNQCRKCEDDYERQRKVAITRQKLGEALAPWMDKQPKPTSKPCELGPLPFNAEISSARSASDGLPGYRAGTELGEK